MTEKNNKSLLEKMMPNRIDEDYFKEDETEFEIAEQTEEELQLTISALKEEVKEITQANQQLQEQINKANMADEQDIEKINEENQTLTNKLNEVESLLQRETAQLRYSEERWQTLQTENEKLKREQTTFVAQEKKQLEDKILELKDQLAKENHSELEGKLKVAETKCTQLEEELTNLKENSTVSESSEELVQARQKINELMLLNQQLREESVQSQKDIGEVMLIAKRQATKILSEADEKANEAKTQMQQEMLAIGDRAKTISEEVKQSQEEINTVFRELQTRLDTMSAIDFEI